MKIYSTTLFFIATILLANTSWPFFDYLRDYILVAFCLILSGLIVLIFFFSFLIRIFTKTRIELFILSFIPALLFGSFVGIFCVRQFLSSLTIRHAGQMILAIEEFHKTTKTYPKSIELLEAKINKNLSLDWSELPPQRIQYIRKKSSYELEINRRRTIVGWVFYLFDSKTRKWSIKEEY